MKTSVLSILTFLLINGFIHCEGFRRYTFEVKDSSCTRLCSTKNILTVNGQFPGPTLYVTRGETVIVDVYNRANYNISIHWHGVKQPRHPWSDGPVYVTQCPIRPGHKFRQKVIFSDEEGTLWWHAHSEYFRATVHGAIVVKPKPGTTYPFPKPHAEIPIILGEWWKEDIVQLYYDTHVEGIDPSTSDAFTINGQPGDFYPCSNSETFKFTVEYGKTYLLRLVNAVMEEGVFFAIAKHNLTVVGTDGSYTKPVNLNYIPIFPGQTIDVLLEANQALDHYYVAARAYTHAYSGYFDNTTTTAILQYKGDYMPTSTTPSLPFLPTYNDTYAMTNLRRQLRSLANEKHPIDVPLEISKKLFITESLNYLPCSTCEGRPTRLATSMNNISFQLPQGNTILQAYYNNISGVYGVNFPDAPPLFFDFTSDYLPQTLDIPSVGTKVKVLDYNSTVEIVFQGVNLFNSSTDHPVHLHGHSFYVVGWGFGNFDKDKDPLKYNLVDPPLQNTINVPTKGWVAIRFRATNPGVWYLHCHLERHVTWGMATTFIVRNGNNSNEKLLPPPRDMPQCQTPLKFVSMLKSYAISY